MGLHLGECKAKTSQPRNKRVEKDLSSAAQELLPNQYPPERKEAWEFYWRSLHCSCKTAR
jgi:hypothetical protein